MIGALYQTIIYRPLVNALIFLYNTVAFEDLGIAIILLTLIVRFALYPLFHKQLHHNAKLQALQPKLKKIKEEHKNNREKEIEATMALFAEQGTNPFMAIFLSFAQLPVVLALYHLFSRGLHESYVAQLYSFVHAPAALHWTLFGLINLAEPNKIVIALTALVQYFQGLTALPRPENPQMLTVEEKAARRNVLIIPLVITTLFWWLKIPTAVGVYWIVSALFSIAQQRLIRAREDKTSNERTATIYQSTR